MAMYYCGECGDLIDDDENPGTDIGDCELCCEDCLPDVEERKEDEACDRADFINQRIKEEGL